jgi:GTP cyclohydrolase I
MTAASTAGGAPLLTNPTRGPRQAIDAAQRQRFEGYLRDIFVALGMPADLPVTAETPRRFLNALVEATSGYCEDQRLDAMDPPGDGDVADRIGQAVDGPIPFFSLCEEHGLPFSGDAYVGSLAAERVLGMSSMTRLVRMCARRFTTPERLGHQVADALERTLAPRGVAVHVRAIHVCGQADGLLAADAQVRTSCWRGSYEADRHLRAEFLRLCGLR